jgi:hypothetical protein
MRATRRFLVLAGAVAVALVVWLVVRGSDDSAAVEDTVATATATGRPDATAAPDAAGSKQERALSLDVPHGAYPVIWVRQGEEVELRTQPGGGGGLVKRVGRRTEFGSPTVFGVVREAGEWAGVTTADMPNGQLGWVHLDARRLDGGWTTRSIVVDVSDRTAQLRKGDQVQRSFAVTVGMPGADTPTGRFAVTDTFRGDLNPAYGCCAVALSATQPHVPSGWLGGTRIAIHGTVGPLGVAASHGCVRAANEDVNALVNQVPLGTPVFIRA